VVLSEWGARRGVLHCTSFQWGEGELGLLPFSENVFVGQPLDTPDFLFRAGPRRNVRNITFPAPIFSVSSNPNCDLIVVGSADGSVYRIDYTTLTYSTTLVPDGHEVWSVSVNASGKTTVIGTARKKPSSGAVLAYEDDKLVFCESFSAPVWGVAVSPSGNSFAAGTWSGEIHYYARGEQGSFKRANQVTRTPERKPVYGMTILDDNTLVAGVYGEGVFRYDLDGAEVGRFHLQGGIYSLASTCNRYVYAASSNGSLVKIDLAAAVVTEIPVSARPIYGVAATPDNQMIVVASTDGNIYSISNCGVELWRHSCRSEVWSVAVSLDGSRVVAGVADGSIQFVQDPCGVVGARKVSEFYTAMGNVSSEPAVISLRKLPWITEAFDIPRAGIGLLARAEENAGAHTAEVSSATRSLASIASRPPDLLLIGEKLLALRDYETALGCFQSASNDLRLRSRALILAAKCLSAIGLTTAATSCYERASKEPFDPQRMRLLYELGLSYEESGDLRSAMDIYEHLVSWDATYRDIFERATRLVQRRDEVNPGSTLTETDIGFPLLGTDVPRPPEVDEYLRPVLEARTMELNLSTDIKLRSVKALELIAELQLLASHDRAVLAYNMPDYMKYEHCNIEDEVKKHLEMIALSTQVPLPTIRRALDIGTATCRYPRYLELLGVKAAGVDVQPSGFKYMKSIGSGFRNFIQGDGADLPFASESFDLVTCMMGTFDHVPIERRQKFAEHMARVLVPGGWAALGIWNVDCEFQDFISMYTQQEREQLRKMLATSTEVREFFTRAGFSEVAFIPVMCIPDRIVRELNITVLNKRSMALVLDIELAVRARFRDIAPQMFLVHARKAD
jgi:SAM-dependent methyltransferase